MLLAQFVFSSGVVKPLKSITPLHNPCCDSGGLFTPVVGTWQYSFPLGLMICFQFIGHLLHVSVEGPSHGFFCGRVGIRIIKTTPAIAKSPKIHKTAISTADTIIILLIFFSKPQGVQDKLEINYSFSPFFSSFFFRMQILGLGLPCVV